VLNASTPEAKRGHVCPPFLITTNVQLDDAALPSDKGSHAGGQIREFLSRAVDADSGLAESYATVVLDERLEPAEQ
jgi:hypothetical protein